MTTISKSGAVAEIGRAVAQQHDLIMDNMPDHWGKINASYCDGLILFNYSRECMATPAEDWTPYELVCRGLIFDAKTGAPVARPFDKFFNYGQAPLPDACLLDVTEKMDGSLGIAYVWRGDWRVSTRGSFTSDQAIWATNWLNGTRVNRAELDRHRGKTLLFEIIYPDNQIVIDYGSFEGLVLLGGRYPYTGIELPGSWVQQTARKLGVRAPLTYPASLNPAAYAKQAEELPGDQEGWVLRFADGTRLKIKGHEYLDLHRWVSNISFARVVEACRDGNIDDLMAACPDRYRAQAGVWLGLVRGTVAAFHGLIDQAWAERPDLALGRKAFALWAKDQHPKLAPYLFRKLDGRDYDDLIYRKEF